MGWRRTADLCAPLIAAALLAAPTALAQALPDDSICATQDGFVQVATEWVKAWDAARISGKLQEPLVTELAVWFTQMENWMLETNEVQATCLALLKSRRELGF
jgi:hypothetical protein